MQNTDTSPPDIDEVSCDLLGRRESANVAFRMSMDGGAMPSNSFVEETLRRREVRYSGLRPASQPRLIDRKVRT